MERLASICVLALIALLVASNQTSASDARKEDGYRGIWYSNQPSQDEYVYKYSGGLGTYCAKHLPLAVYAPAANRTFFVYGGTKGIGEPKPLLEMVGYYDHSTGMVSKPTVVTEKGTGDAHHNPTLSICKDGFLWIFASSHGGKDGLIYKSRDPYSIDEFDRMVQKEFTYPQPRYFEGFGHVFLFTKYTAGRELYVSTSKDGASWSEDRKIAGFGGHYQVSWSHENRLGTAFNWHPPAGGLNARTNLYYMETSDFGETWTTAAGKPLATPLNAPRNDALVRDYQAEGLLVYMKDLNFDKEGRPVILYLLSKGYESGPTNGPRIWMTARWTGKVWDLRRVATSDHNYDMGSLCIEEDGDWRVIAPTEPGPQAYCTGGEMAMWKSEDEGKTWAKVRDLTRNSALNHTYARRPVNAHPDFYAFWADGNALAPSESRLYFTNKTGDKVCVLPRLMTRDLMMPHLCGD